MSQMLKDKSNLLYMVLLLLSVGYGCNMRQVRQPNIVIILADDQGWGDVGFNGNPLVETPHIDSLAAEGVVFDHFYVNSVCSPTRAEMLTGRYHVRGGVYGTSAGGERLDLDESTFVEAFQQAGYKTAAFGKWHNGAQYPYHPLARGFDEFYGYCAGHWGSYFDAILEHNDEQVQSTGYLTDDLTSQAMEFIQTNKEAPFLVYLPLNTPHSPMQVPDKWWQKFEDVPLPIHRYSDLEDADHTLAAYAMAENIDWNVGRLRQHVKELGLTGETIFIYFSDNGPNGYRWNGDMKGIKGHTDEGGVRSPFVISWPDGLPDAKHVTQIAHAIDLFPTLSELSGVGFQSEQPLDGVSLVPLLQKERPEWHDRFLYSYWQGRLSVRSQEFRLGRQNELYHMPTDPGQRTDVRQQYPEEYAALLHGKKQWQQSVRSELPTEDTRKIPVGHPASTVTRLPADDARTTGGIQRSNRWPNCSYFTNWTSNQDTIYWDVEVIAPGRYEAVVHYTCDSSDVGSVINLGFESAMVSASVLEGHDPPARGMEHDRVLRGESYVKNFKPLTLGAIELSQGNGRLSLSAATITGDYVMDFRLLTLKRIAD